ncbi:DUF934 domain-containing protein [Candidatus Spongiihabitans sp.]|uniref:DUF934 domain-containing protein n=1 Tax=Candidatus Spongiihabitans sp. TaxID=3101308 RepID=UPI003C6F1CE1
MQIIKNRQIIDSPWLLEPDQLDSEPGLDQPHRVPSVEDESRPRLVSVRHWLEIRNPINGQHGNGPGKRHSDHLGIYLDADDSVSSIAEYLDSIPVIAIIFGSFTEGRGYSQAVELRQQHHYQGEIRAIGAAVDNLSLMERCGINAFQLTADDPERDLEHDLKQALSFFTEIDTVYPYN